MFRYFPYKMDYEESKISSFKVIMLGDSTVGKTSLLTQLCSNYFNTDPKTTIGGSFVEKTLNTTKGKVKLQLWDTAGQEQYRCLVPIYSRGANAAIIVFDVSKPKTFETANEWYDLVNRNKANVCLIFTAANKMDLEVELNLDAVEEWSKEHHAQFFKTSAKDITTVEMLFLNVAETLVNQYSLLSQPDDIDEQLAEKSTKDTCC